MNHDVLTCADLPSNTLQQLLTPYDLEVVWVNDNVELPGSFWGDPEAGLITNRLYVRPTTPVQSAVHEACHYICMDMARRRNLHTDDGGGYDEENSVCYLQTRMMWDMDSWGYSFRLGSTRAWFEQDAEDARAWLQQHQLLDQNGEISWQCRSN